MVPRVVRTASSSLVVPRALPCRGHAFGEADDHSEVRSSSVCATRRRNSPRAGARPRPRQPDDWVWTRERHCRSAGAGRAIRPSPVPWLCVAAKGRPLILSGASRRGGLPPPLPPRSRPPSDPSPPPFPCSRHQPSISSSLYQLTPVEWSTSARGSPTRRLALGHGRHEPSEAAPAAATVPPHCGARRGRGGGRRGATV